MIDEQNMMISAFTIDPLKRSLQLIPAIIRFGVVKTGVVFTSDIVVRN